MSIISDQGTWILKNRKAEIEIPVSPSQMVGYVFINPKLVVQPITSAHIPTQTKVTLGSLKRLGLEGASTVPVPQNENIPNPVVTNKPSTPISC
jgi:hypothetical protein